MLGMANNPWDNELTLLGYSDYLYDICGAIKRYEEAYTSGLNTIFKIFNNTTCSATKLRAAMCLLELAPDQFFDTVLNDVIYNFTYLRKDFGCAATTFDDIGKVFSFYVVRHNDDIAKKTIADTLDNIYSLIDSSILGGDNNLEIWQFIKAVYYDSYFIYLVRYGNTFNSRLLEYIENQYSGDYIVLHQYSFLTALLLSLPMGTMLNNNVLSTLDAIETSVINEYTHYGKSLSTMISRNIKNKYDYIYL